MKTVKHKAGNFLPDLMSILYVTWKIGFFKKWHYAEFEATRDILRTDGNVSWMKIFGVKSSVVTTTNSESLAVYRTNKKGNLETGYYYRNGESHPDKWNVFEVIEHDFRTDGDTYTRTFTMKRRWKEWIPCFPWAGGKIAPENDIKYKIKFLKK